MPVGDRKVFCNRSCPILLNSYNYTYYYYASDCIFGILSSLKVKMWLNQWSQIRWMDGHCNLAMPCTHKNYTTHMFITEERRSASSSSSSCVCGAVRCGAAACVCVCVSLPEAAAVCPPSSSQNPLLPIVYRYELSDPSSTIFQSGF